MAEMERDASWVAGWREEMESTESETGLARNLPPPLPPWGQAIKDNPSLAETNCNPFLEGMRVSWSMDIASPPPGKVANQRGVCQAMAGERGLKRVAAIARGGKVARKQPPSSRVRKTAPGVIVLRQRERGLVGGGLSALRCNADVTAPWTASGRRDPWTRPDLEMRALAATLAPWLVVTAPVRSRLPRRPSSRLERGGEFWSDTCPKTERLLTHFPRPCIGRGDLYLCESARVTSRGDALRQMAGRRERRTGQWEEPSGISRSLFWLASSPSAAAAGVMQGICKLRVFQKGRSAKGGAGSAKTGSLELG